MAPAPVIAVDGPSGSGKGTLSRRLAEQLGWHLLDSGALYRIVGCVAQRTGFDLPSVEVGSQEAADIASLARALDIRFAGEQVLVTLPESTEALDLTDEIRTEDGGTAASYVAALQLVRDAILDVQHNFQRPPGLVADGRDMGTVVFPSAPLKIFLDASAEERAQRRYKQLKNKGLSVSLRGLLEQIEERDARDRERAVAPLRPAEDAFVIDSTKLSIEGVLDQVMQLASEHGFSPAS